MLEDYKNDVRSCGRTTRSPSITRETRAYLPLRFREAGHKGFWATHDALFEGQKNLEDAGLQEIAKKVGLNWDQANAAITSGKYAAKIDQSMDLAADFEARGTPHFFINGRRLSGAQPYEKFKELIDSQLAIAKDLVAKGVTRDKCIAS